MKKSRALAAVLAAVVVLGAIAGLLVYFHQGTSAPIESLRVSSPGLDLSAYYSTCHTPPCSVIGENVTLLVLITNNGTDPITSTQVRLDNSPLGSCDESIAPSVSYPCEVVGYVSCSVIQGETSYAMNAKATFENGKTASYSWLESPQFSGDICPA